MYSYKIEIKDTQNEAMSNPGYPQVIAWTYIDAKSDADAKKKAKRTQIVKEAIGNPRYLVHLSLKPKTIDLNTGDSF